VVFDVAAKDALLAFVRDHGAQREQAEVALAFVRRLRYGALELGISIDRDRYEAIAGPFDEHSVIAVRWRVIGRGARVVQIYKRSAPRSTAGEVPVDDLETDNDGNPVFTPEAHGLPPDDSPTAAMNVGDHEPED
jgi:hypothetical protein